MMEEFIHWLEPYFLLLATCDEILLWKIEIRMKNHLVSDSNCKHYKAIIPQIFTRYMTTTVTLTFNVGDTIPRFTISIEQDK